MTALHKLFEPARIGTLQVPNRIVMPAMGTIYGNHDGTVNDRLVDYYEERARGGVGLIIVEVACVAAGGRANPGEIGVWDDRFLPGLIRLVEAAHRHGSKIALQLHHAGRQRHFEIEDCQPVAASAIPCPMIKEMPRELTIAEIQDLVAAFGQAARRARDAGFDAVEFHGAHGYLIDNFLSAFSNKRTDEYGGDLERRMRFALEIVRSARQSAGRDYPFIFRISGDEFIEDGLTLDETRIIAQRLEKEGVDCIHVSGGCYAAFHKLAQPASEERGCLVPLAVEIKKVVKVPVIAVGRINDPRLAESILAESKADLVAMGRALIADPDLPNKAREGAFNDIRMCTACCTCIDGMVGSVQPLVCAVNAAVGRERETAFTRAPKPRVVLVAGGGPAGLEAARVAASRGHRVTLFEESYRLGGQLLLASLPPHKQELTNLAAYLAGQMAKLGVEVRLGQILTPELVSRLKPDAVVVATGSKPAIPRIPGLSGRNVMTARDLLAGTKPAGQRVSIIGGGRIGCEAAEFLKARGKDVTILEMMARIAGDMGPMTRFWMLKRLRADGVKMETKCEATEINAQGVVVVTNGLRRTFEADTVVIATGTSANSALADQLKGAVSELHVIGDCAGGRDIKDAIEAGFNVGLKL